MEQNSRLKLRALKKPLSTKNELLKNDEMLCQVTKVTTSTLLTTVKWRFS